jgi:hypothetical protein
MKDLVKRMIVKMMIMAEIGRWKKMRKLPCEKRKD